MKNLSINILDLWSCSNGRLYSPLSKKFTSPNRIFYNVKEDLIFWRFISHSHIKKELDMTRKELNIRYWLDKCR